MSVKIRMAADIGTAQRDVVDLEGVFSEYEKLLEHISLEKKWLLYSSLYTSRARFEKEDSVRVEGAVENMRVYLPVAVIHVSNTRKRYRAELNIHVLDNVSYEVWYSRGYVMLKAVDSSGILRPYEVYTFPPVNLASYLFVHLNNHFQKTVAEIIEQCSKALPKAFWVNLENYRTAEESAPDIAPRVSQVILPRASTKQVLNLFNHISPISALGFEVTKMHYYSSVYRISSRNITIERNGILYSFKTDDSGVVYIASTIDNGLEQLRKNISILRNILHHSYRALLVLDIARRIR